MFIPYPKKGATVRLKHDWNNKEGAFTTGHLFMITKVEPGPIAVFVHLRDKDGHTTEIPAGGVETVLLDSNDDVIEA